MTQLRESALCTKAFTELAELASYGATARTLIVTTITALEM
ncbi:hypothetical protein [Streptosporangium sp. NPDC002607]